ncbi:MAG: hypothetical protein QOI94_2603 [Acidobacteriaceae bacterium]|nr:hypothetical protein [Acidobacteriaceae bacterium]
MGHPCLVEGTEFLTDFTRFPPDLKAIQGERNRAQFPEALRGCVKTPIPNLVPWGRVELPISTQDCRPGLSSGVPSGLDSSSRSF